MRQTCRGIFKGHRTGESRTFLGGNVDSHAYTSDRRPPGNIVDHQHSFQADAGFVYMNYLEWAQVIGKRENIIHPSFSM